MTSFLILSAVVAIVLAEYGKDITLTRLKECVGSYDHGKDEFLDVMLKRDTRPDGTEDFSLNCAPGYWRLLNLCIWTAAGVLENPTDFPMFYTPSAAKHLAMPADESLVKIVDDCFPRDIFLLSAIDELEYGYDRFQALPICPDGQQRLDVAKTMTKCYYHENKDKFIKNLLDLADAAWKE